MSNISFNDFKKKFSIDTNKSISTHSVVLPSDGSKALIKPMRVKEQREFLKALEKKDEFLVNEAFDKILSNCVESIDGNPFDNDLLCIQDRTYLLIEIRKISTPDKIVKISHIDQATQKVYNDIPVDLSQLKVIPSSRKVLWEDIELNEFTKIRLGPVTRKNEKDLEAWVKAKSKDSVIDRRYCAYAALVKKFFAKDDNGEYIEVDGAKFSDIHDFIINNCSQDHLALFDDYVKSLDFGIKLTFHFKNDEDGIDRPEEEANLISFFIM